MVAKSFQNLEIVGEPYLSSGRMYIKVKNSAGNLRQVRWYTEKEYQKMYGEVALNSKYIGVDGCDHSKEPFFKTQKEVLGFKNGFITIFKGNTYDCKEWLKANGATFTRLWGWSFSSEKEIPSDLPSGIEPVRLNWENVGTNLEVLQPEEKVIKAVESVIYEPDGSEFVGEIGETIELYLAVDSCFSLDGSYGISNVHIMHDDCGNTFNWTTSAKKLEVGEEYHIRGKVKDHRVYKNSKQTVINYCKII